MCWQMAGYLMIIYIAGIQGISNDVIEASTIDGASAWQRMKYIILPLVRPAFTVSIFLTLSNSFKLYDQNLSLKAGGPSNMGQAQAKAIILLLVVGVISLIQVYVSNKGEVEA